MNATDLPRSFDYLGIDQVLFVLICLCVRLLVRPIVMRRPIEVLPTGSVSTEVRRNHDVANKLAATVRVGELR